MDIGDKPHLLDGKKMKKVIVYLLILLICTGALWAYGGNGFSGSMTGEVCWNINPKYFTKAAEVLTEDSGWFVSLKSFQAGFDASFNLNTVFGLGVDLTARVTDHSNDLNNNATHIGCELMAETRFNFQNGGTSVPSVALLLGAAMYTNTDIFNIVPGAGLKLALDMYPEDAGFMWGLIMRATAFYFDHEDPFYSCLDLNISIGVRFGYGAREVSW